MTGPLVTAIEQTWAAIQARHRDVPDVVLTLGNGSTRPGQLTLGHFHAGKWATGEDEARLPELFVGGEGLARGPRAVLGTLLHEATHGVAAARGIKDTSRQGRYHNTRFRELATGLGITVERDPRIGWSITAVPEATAEHYADQIAQLGAALTAHRLADVHGAGRTTSNNGLVAECGCDPPRKIRLSRTAYDTGPVVCGVCDAEFTSTDTARSATTTGEGHAAMTTRDHEPTRASVADQVGLDAQLRWLTYLHTLDVPAEHLEQAAAPLRARAEQATAAAAAREDEHQHAARLGLGLYRQRNATAALDEDAREEATRLAAQQCAALYHADDPKQSREAAVLARPVTEGHIDAGPTPEARALLIRTAAAQQAIEKLADSHAATVTDVIGLYHEGRDHFGYDPDRAGAAALIEAHEGVPAVYGNAYDDLAYRAEERASQADALRVAADRAEALVEMRRLEHHELATIVTTEGRHRGQEHATDQAWQVLTAIRGETAARARDEDQMLASPVRGSDIDAGHGEARESLIRIAAAQQAIGGLRGSHVETIRHAAAEYERARRDAFTDDEAWQRAHMHATAAVDADIEDHQHTIRQDAQARAEAATWKLDERRLADLVSGAQQRRAAAATKPDDVNRLRDMLLRDQEQSRRHRADDPDLHQHNALVNSQAAHPAPREPRDRHQAADADQAEDECRRDDRDPVQQARLAVDLLAARGRELGQQRAEQTRADQLNRWHHDDHRDDDAATRSATATGGRAIYGGGAAQ